MFLSPPKVGAFEKPRKSSSFWKAFWSRWASNNGVTFAVRSQSAAHGSDEQGQMAKQFRERNVMVFPGIFAKTRMPIPTPPPPRAYSEVSRTIRDIDFETVDRAITPESLRHNYAIRALEKPGLFQPRPYVYTCVRCRYSFIVNESRGSILSVDRNGTPLPEPENTTRIETLADGPCPSLRMQTRQAHRTVPIAQPSRFVGALARVVAFLLGPPHQNDQRRERSRSRQPSL
jgi:hypothetical protein